MKMSEFESSRNMRTIIIAVVVIAIICVGGYVGWSLLSGGGPTTTTTTNTNTTTTTTTSSEHVLTIITRHDTSIHNVFEPAFLASDLAKNLGITDIVWKTPSEAFWDDVLGAGGIDVCWGGGPTLFDQIMRDGYLQSLNDTYMQQVAARVPDSIAGADMKRVVNNTLYWVAAAISTFGFTVNHQFLNDYSLPTPTNWTDLAQPIYGSLLPNIPTIAMGNAPDTTSNTRIYEIITQGMGWDTGWATLARMAGSSNIYGGSVETQSAAEQGQVGISMSIDFYGYQTQYKNPDCEYILPTGQSIVNGDPIAIAKGTAHLDYAEAFVDFVLSNYGQSLWLDPSIRRMPVLVGAFQEPLGLAAPDLYAVFNQTVATAGIDFNDTLSLELNAALIYYFESAFTDAHTELVNCWSAIVAAYYDHVIDMTQVNYYATLMGTPVTAKDPNTNVNQKFTLAYARSIDNSMIYDSAFASTMQTRWTAAAKAQYNSVAAMIAALYP
jgi:ABC-type Fe3+ transport system substrate-binding protein